MALMMASRRPIQPQCDKQQPDLCLWTMRWDKQLHDLRRRTKSATVTLIDHITWDEIERPMPIYLGGNGAEQYQ